MEFDKFMHILLRHWKKFKVDMTLKKRNKYKTNIIPVLIDYRTRLELYIST